MTFFLQFFFGICGASCITSLYLYLCKYYTIKDIKKLELKLSEIKEISDYEYFILLSMREYLKENT